MELENKSKERVLDSRQIKVSASLWSADLTSLKDEVKRVEPHCDCIHIDIADAQYSGNLVFGFDFIRAIKKVAALPLDVHLMLSNPAHHITKVIDYGADRICIHPGAAQETLSTIKIIKKEKIEVGLGLSLDTKIHDIKMYLPIVDYVIVMGTPIGIKGAETHSSAYKKIMKLARNRRAMRLSYLIQSDGGIRKDSVPSLIACGTDILTAGSLLFEGDIYQNCQWMKNQIKHGLNLR